MALRVGRRSVAIFLTLSLVTVFFLYMPPRTRGRVSGRDPLDENKGNTSVSLNASSPCPFSPSVRGGLPPARLLLLDACGLSHGGGIRRQSFSGWSRHFD